MNESGNFFKFNLDKRKKVVNTMNTVYHQQRGRQKVWQIIDIRNSNINKK